MTNDMDPRAFYDEFGEDEWERLQVDPTSRLEFENTVAYLDRHLPDEGRVLDAGGGPGRYACWLADRGLGVAHLDLSAEQVRIAREKVAERSLADRVEHCRGDVRALPYPDGTFDAVCCLGGPLSHVVDESERLAAARELRRVAGGGAPVFVSVIGRLAAVRDSMKHVLPTESGERHGFLDRIALDGAYTAELVAEHADGGWAECHFFRADELERELDAAGFDVEQLVGLEGPAANLGAELAEASAAAREEVREAVRLLREDRAVADFSEHILAICRA